MSFDLRKYGLAAALLALGFAMPAAAGPLTSDAAPSSERGYIGANFHIGGSTLGEGFIVTDLDTGKLYFLPFSTTSGSRAQHHQTVLIDLPPGRYVVSFRLVTHWMPTATGDTPYAIKSGRLAEPFDVKAGQVAFLGGFLVNGQSMRSLEQYDPEPMTLDRAKALVAQTFPGFAAVAIDCPACDDRAERKAP